MDRLFKWLLLRQDKANRFVWSVVLMDVVLGLSLLVDHLFDRIGGTLANFVTLVINTAHSSFCGKSDKSRLKFL